MLLLKAVLGEQRRVTREFSIGITTTAGHRLIIDSKADPIVSEERRDDVALAIITSDESLSALLTGSMDLENAEPDTFLWGGDLSQWAALIDAVSAYSSIGVRTLKGTAR